MCLIVKKVLVWCAFDWRRCHVGVVGQHLFCDDINGRFLLWSNDCVVVGCYAAAEKQFKAKNI